MTEPGTDEFDEAVRKAVREVLRGELKDYLQTETVRPMQIRPVDEDGNAVPVGYTLRVASDGVARFEL